MKLYFGTRTAWAGPLIQDIMYLCGDTFLEDDPSLNQANYYRNLRQALTWAAEGILTKNGKRNYRHTVETYFQSVMTNRSLQEDSFWNWGQFILKGRIPFGKVGYYTVQLMMEGKSLTLEVKCYGSGFNLQVETATKIKTWRQDILVAWLHRWNWEILQAPLAAEGRVMCLGEFLAAELYHNCGDEAGRNATYDAVEDRGKRWLLS